VNALKNTNTILSTLLRETGIRYWSYNSLTMTISFTRYRGNIIEEHYKFLEFISLIHPEDIVLGIAFLRTLDESGGKTKSTDLRMLRNDICHTVNFKGRQTSSNRYEGTAQIFKQISLARVSKLSFEKRTDAISVIGNAVNRLKRSSVKKLSFSQDLTAQFNTVIGQRATIENALLKILVAAEELSTSGTTLTISSRNTYNEYHKPVLLFSVKIQDYHLHDIHEADLFNPFSVINGNSIVSENLFYAKLLGEYYGYV